MWQLFSIRGQATKKRGQAMCGTKDAPIWIGSDGHRRYNRGIFYLLSR